MKQRPAQQANVWAALLFVLVPLGVLGAIVVGGGASLRTATIGLVCAVVLVLLTRILSRGPVLYLWTEPAFGVDADQLVHLVDGRLAVKAKLRELRPGARRATLIKGTVIGLAMLVFIGVVGALGESLVGSGFLGGFVSGVFAACGGELVERSLKVRRWLRVHRGRLIPSRPMVYAFAAYAQSHPGVPPTTLAMRDISATSVV